MYTILTCQKKSGYPTKMVALFYLRRIRKNDPKANVRVFKCPICPKWHIGGVK